MLINIYRWVKFYLAVFFANEKVEWATWNNWKPNKKNLVLQFFWYIQY